LRAKCLAKMYCSYDVDCIVVSYKLQAADDICVGLFSLEDGTLLYKFTET